MKKNLAILLFVSISVSLFSQEWTISEIIVNVTGITQKDSIIRVSHLKEGQVFKSKQNLEETLFIARDNLENERIFESIILNYEVVSESQVKIVIDIVDSWNIVALPYPKFDSNSGFTFSLRGRDYNFLGLMEPLAVNLNYNLDEDGDHNFDLGLNYVFNFLVDEHYYSLDLDQNLYYKPSDENDKLYMSTSLSLGTSYLLPWDIYRGNQISYSLSTSIEKKYSIEGISDSRDDLSLGFSHGFSLGQTSWGDNNYRDGISYSLSNSWGLSLDEETDFEDEWSSSVSSSISFHKSWYPLGYSGRVYIKQNIDDSRDERGGPLRGVLDYKVTSRGGIYINNGLYITVWNNPDIWEIMGGPCLDMGYLWDVPDGQDNIVWSIAVEGLCYPAFAKSFQARITIGLNGNGFMDSTESGMERLSGNMELFFGLGTFF